MIDADGIGSGTDFTNLVTVQGVKASQLKPQSFVLA